MSRNGSYSAFARRFSLKYPVLSFVGIQINFWIIANILLSIIIHFYSLLISEVYDTPRIVSFLTILIVPVTFGLVYGTILGLTDYYLDNRFFKKQSLGKIIILKVAISFIVLVILIAIIKYIVIPFILGSTINELSIKQNNKVWNIVFSILAIYYFFTNLIISFINQVNKKYGPGVLIPLLLGKYRSPREEEKIFMFMDLKASTTLAEQLGHLKYSAFIRDAFMDINLIVSSFYAEIYQYVGDEIIVTWQLKEGLNNLSCLHFFFKCEKKFQEREEYYIKTYGTVPTFKAGVHLGKVTAVEIGEIKRDIAYHGDTLNTTSRIQSLCNEHQKKILISDTLLKYIPDKSQFRVEKLGRIKLKGKIEDVGIASIEYVH